ncbi:ATP-binding protein [Cohnella cellulosilytica]|uniref:histidine kinase n=1 Tax=Cohnella cellulosilytica TaxID=986710 RepID=A0ABW2FKT8_9BACL
MNKQLSFLLGSILVFGIVTCVNMFNWLTPMKDYPEAKGGVLDSSRWNYDERGIIPLRGEWEFYEGLLLEPEDFRGPDSSRLKEKRTLVDVPGGWKGVLGSDGKNGYGAGTYRLLVRVDGAESFSLRAKKIRLSSHIYINGADLGGNGLPALSEERFVPSNFPFFGTAPSSADGTVEIVIQVASFRFIEGGLVQAPEFGPTGAVMERRDHSRLADMILVTTMLVFGLYYAGMFKQWRRERHLMHFCFFCLSTGLFFLIDNEILATALVPDIPFSWLQKLVFLFAYLTFVFFGLYVYRYLDEKNNSAYLWLCRFGFVYLVLFVLAPNHYLSFFWQVAIVLQIVAFGLIFYAIFRNHRRSPHDSYYMMMGCFFLIATWIYGQTRYHFALDNPYYMIVTPMLLVFSQAFLMSDRMRTAFRRSERLTAKLLQYDRQKDEFLAKTSHELRTPLHGIVNLSQALLDDRETPLRGEQRDNIHMLHLLGRRLSGLVHDILDLNRIRHGQLTIQPTSVDVGMSVRFVIETLTIASTNREVKLVNALPPVLPLVKADENRLRQILHNLMENGLNNTKKGRVEVTAERRGEELAISVTDTGRGIPPEALAGLFQPFVQYEEEEGRASSNSGLGLGLSISKQLTELQGGRLEVESQVGVGSRFTFTLPVDSESEEVAAAIEPETTPFYALAGTTHREPGQRFHVLIVDDEPSNLKILIHAAGAMACGYTAVGGGAEALAALSGHPKPDLVLLDLMMPGVSGLDVCREIRKLHGLAELPVLMLTASGQTGDMVASFVAGANDILQKPFELAELKARVQSLLAMKSSSEQAVRREMDFLQAQITPHFLYNSMNALVGLSYKDVDKLRETIHHLTTYLRAKFTFVFQGERVELERELELVKAYLAIEQLRFGDRLLVRYRIEEGIRCLLPPLTLQPIVENAVRHGIGPKPEGGTLTVTVGRFGAGIEIVVEDDGIGMDGDTLDALDKGKSGGVGIRNVNRRLQMLYGGRLEYRSLVGHGTQVKLRIPGGSL